MADETWELSDTQLLFLTAHVLIFGSAQESEELGQKLPQNKVKRPEVVEVA